MSRTLSFFLLLVLAFAVGHADDRVHATYRYICGKEEHLVSQAEEIAVQRARLQAIEEQYGVFVQRIEGLTMTNSQTDFASQSTSQLRGIWIKDSQPPVIATSFVDDQILVEAEVWGIARQLKGAGPETRVALLRNRPDERFASVEFVDGDSVYLSFRSAVDGYLAVFTRDDSVRCLIPDHRILDGLQPIKANKSYIFFNTPNTEIQAVADYEVEAHTLYVLFSTERFFRPLIKDTAEGGVPLYSIDDFFAILAKRQKSDENLQVTPLNFLIRKSE